jgi:hypothetical protein
VWHLGEDTPEDDSPYALTGVRLRSGDALECEFDPHNVATLRWYDVGSNNASRYTYTAEGQKNQEVFAPPAFTEGGTAYEDPSSEHRWVFPHCAADCEFTHTFNPKSVGPHRP